MVQNELSRDVGVGDEDKSGEDCDAIAEKWMKYRPLMESGELLESFLPWRGVEDRQITSVGLKQVNKMRDFSDDTVHLPFKSSTRGGYLFVCPRFFRGQGLSMEVSAFLDFARIVSSDLKDYVFNLGLVDGESIEVIALHPLMVTTTGVPDYAKRAPHPALFLRIVNEKKLY